MHSYGGGAEPLALWLASSLDKSRFQVSVHCLRHLPALACEAEKLGLDFSMPSARGLPALAKHFLHATALARKSDVVLGSLELQSIFWAALAAPGKTVAWLHKDIAGYLACKPLLYGRLYHSLLNWALGRTQATVCVSEGIRTSTEKLWPLLASKLLVFWNPLDAKALSQRALGPLPPELAACFSSPVILGVGRLESQKAFHLLLEAHALLMQRGLPHHLCIAGEGSQRAFLERRIKELGLADSVWLPGFVDPAPLMAKAVVLAMSSHFEGCPMVLLEALALDLPIVATDCPSGPREILEEGRWGALAPMDDAQALADALEKALRYPPDAARLEEIRKRAESYAPAAIIPRWEELLEQAATDGRKNARPGSGPEESA